MEEAGRKVEKRPGRSASFWFAARKPSVAPKVKFRFIEERLDADEVGAVRIPYEEFDVALVAYSTCLRILCFTADEKMRFKKDLGQLTAIEGTGFNDPALMKRFNSFIDTEKKRLEDALDRMRRETLWANEVKLRIDDLAEKLQRKPPDAFIRITSGQWSSLPPLPPVSAPASNTPPTPPTTPRATTTTTTTTTTNPSGDPGANGQQVQRPREGGYHLLKKYDVQGLLKAREEYIRDMTREEGMMIGGRLMELKEGDVLLDVHRKYFASIVAQEINSSAARCSPRGGGGAEGPSGSGRRNTISTTNGSGATGNPLYSAAARLYSSSLDVAKNWEKYVIDALEERKKKQPSPRADHEMAPPEAATMVAGFGEAKEGDVLAPPNKEEQKEKEEERKKEKEEEKQHQAEALCQCIGREGWRTMEEMVEYALLWCPLVSGRTHSMNIAWFVALCTRNGSPFRFSATRTKAGNEWTPIALDAQCLDTPAHCLRLVGQSREMMNVLNGRGMSDIGRGRICRNCGKLIEGTVDGVAIDFCSACGSVNGIEEEVPEVCGVVTITTRCVLLLFFEKDRPPHFEVDVQYTELQGGRLE